MTGLCRRKACGSYVACVQRGSLRQASEQPSPWGSQEAGECWGGTLRNSPVKCPEGTSDVNPKVHCGHRGFPFCAGITTTAFTVAFRPAPCQGHLLSTPIDSPTSSLLLFEHARCIWPQDLCAGCFLCWDPPPTDTLDVCRLLLHLQSLASTPSTFPPPLF